MELKYTQENGKAVCSGCPQQHYAPDPPGWWGVTEDGVYCIVCCLKMKIETWVDQAMDPKQA